MPNSQDKSTFDDQLGFPIDQLRISPALKAQIAEQTFTLPIEGDPVGWLLKYLPSSVVQLDRPPRKIKANPQSFTGQTYLFRLEQSVPYESGIECDFLERVDMSPGVTNVRAQSLCLEFIYQDLTYHCFPDFELEYDPSSTNELPFKFPSLVVEIKSEADLKERFEKYSPKFAASVLFCIQNIRQFLVLTEKQIRTTQLANVKQFRKYLRRPIDHLVQKTLVNILRAQGENCIEQLIQSASQSGEVQQADVVDTLFAMIAQGEIGFNCNHLITKQSPLWLPSPTRKHDSSNHGFGGRMR